MTTFDDREKAFEDKYKHDQEIQFRVEMRRNKLLGLWAADLLGKTGDEADSYAKEVVVADFEEPGIDDVLRKVMGDFQKAEVDISEHRLRKKMDEFFSLAKDQVMAE